MERLVRTSGYFLLTSELVKTLWTEFEAERSWENQSSLFNKRAEVLPPEYLLNRKHLQRPGGEVPAPKQTLRVFLSSAVIEPCLDNELTEFPLRMRDWLKNVLVTLYARDEDNNLLTEKQKLRVRPTSSS